MTEDNQQISVSELLKRNGQQVESSGGRRRRGAKGGISVAELTGEIPSVHGRPESRALISEPAPAPNRAPAPEPNLAPVSERVYVPEPNPAPVSEPVYVPEPNPAPVPERTASLATRFGGDVDEVDDVDDVDEPIASRPAGRVNGAASAGTSRDHQGAWVSRFLQQEGPDTGIVVPVDEPAAALPVENPDPVPSGSEFFAESRDEDSAGWNPEPQLLSGSTLAGDLMRHSQDSVVGAGDETDIIEAADSAALDQDQDGDAGKSKILRRSRKQARAEKAKKPRKKVDAVEDSTREWLVLIGQGVVAVIAGALLFKGFEKLWVTLPWVALVLALLMIVGLVAMVRIVRRTDDITSFVIAVVVGMIVTLGPLVLMLTSG
ncbi:hypothetical protein [Rhodococcus sp. NPDC049939]|uniref:hypothetical protein n=1 Tax=Rhodococcus sp. NPDC049939 TaxID=3155511 RepID=UPI0033E419AE